MNNEMPQDHAPDGYRFLFQDIGGKNEGEAMQRALRIFGAARCQNLIVKKGVCLPKDRLNPYKDWRFNKSGGYMIYIPIQERNRDAERNPGPQETA